jgi:hypothetical protein
MSVDKDSSHNSGLLKHRLQSTTGKKYLVPTLVRAQSPYQQDNGGESAALGTEDPPHQAGAVSVIDREKRSLASRPPAGWL